MRLSLVAGMVIVAIGFWQRCRPGCGGRMKRERFSEEQIIAVLREHEAGGKTGDLARNTGSRRRCCTTGTLYNWKAKYGGMDVSEAKRLKALEDEDRKLKKLLAESMLDILALKELLSKKWQGPPRSEKRPLICAVAWR